MANEAFDQDAWLARIGYHGPRAPTLETLRAVIAAHSGTIAYESIDVLLNRPPKLDLVALQRKMISVGSGGYCFEQNMLFSSWAAISGLQGDKPAGARSSRPGH